MARNLSNKPSFVKSISDPIYGSIPLTQIEIEVIDTSVFQRLRRIGQLGLVELVFPSASYSRFSHSIGACHVMGLILKALYPDQNLELHLWQEHRLAMLLHDVGHYFMSHTTDRELKAYYSEEAIQITGAKLDMKETPGAQSLSHEAVGKHILLLDPELNDILVRNGFDPERIGQIFNGEAITKLSNLVSSDLDADRLDYLMRSSQATGLPYGHYDRDFLLRNLCFAKTAPNSDGKQVDYVCIREKAVRAADHFLLCRQFDFLQVICQKTVVGFERMLATAIRFLLKTEQLKLAETDLDLKIKSGKWSKLDDPWLWKTLRKVQAEGDERMSEIEAEVFRRLVERDPPKLLYNYEQIHHLRSAVGGELHKNYFKHGLEKCPILKDSCLHWRKTFTLTKVRTHSYSDEVEDPDEIRQTIHVDYHKNATPIFHIPYSLTAALGNQEYEMARVYFLGPDSSLEAARLEMKRAVTDWNLPGVVSE